MVKLKQIDIVNYRSCLNTRVNLNENLTALIGINGVGKSNILNAIRLLGKVRHVRYNYDEDLLKELYTTTLKLKLEVDGGNYLLQAGFFYDTDERNRDDIFQTVLKYKSLDVKGAKWVKLENRLVEAFERQLYYERMGRGLRYYAIDKMSHIDRELLRFLLSISYYSATQFSDPTLCPSSMDLDEARLPRVERSHEQFLFDLYKSWKRKDSSYRKYLNTINRSGIGLIDELDFIEHTVPSTSFKVKSGGKIHQIAKDRKLFIPSITLDNLKLTPNQLSEGTFKTIALVFYILNDESDLVLIEEPEVCVHHGLLSSIIELIKLQTKKKQIIISTHSDYILDKLSPENLLIVQKERGLGTKVRPLSKVLSRNEYSALRSYLDSEGNLGEYWKEGGFENE